MDHDHERPVFIFGSPRSGTSLVSRILDSHPRIGIPHESLLFSTFWPIRERYGDLGASGNAERLLRHMLTWGPVAEWQPRVSFAEAMARVRDRTFHELFRAVVTTWTDGQGKVRWGEKSPGHAFYWREILDGFPGARIVHVVRDVRDATLSWQRARQGPRHALTLARRWVAYIEHMETVRRALPADAFAEIRYEDLLQDPEACCRRLCAFLGEDFDPAVLAFHRNTAAYNTDATNRANLSRPVIKDNRGKWEHQFSAREIRWIEAVAREPMVRYGYQPVTSGAMISGAERMWISAFSAPVSRLGGMLIDRKGHREGLQKVLFPIAARLRWP